jgi:two-component system, chemotaxis family, chemotaxis protein CheY
MRHCLIVDDSDVIRKVAHRVLEEFHVTSTEAENAQEALDYCKRAMPDIILLDWHMPHLSAHDFLFMLRNQPGGETPVIIYCTTENDRIDIAKARQYGANAVLFKPFDKDTLGRALLQVGMN